MKKLILMLIPVIMLAEPVNNETLKQINESLIKLTKAIEQHTKAIQDSVLNTNDTGEWIRH